MVENQKFHQLRAERVINTFNINKLRNCLQIEQWLIARETLSEFENKILDLALTRYEELNDGWNEEELKMHFISSILNVANPNIPKVCKTYFERPLEGVIDNYELSVVCDCMVASPRKAGDPDKPYFFLQEYKQAQRFGRTDPEGQMLAAMLLAQKINADNKHIYGCFVIERQWTFTTLLDRDYCSSQTYNSTKKPELLQIVYILIKLKELILNR